MDEHELRFEWDEEKAAQNLDKHGIDFEDAIAIFESAVLESRSDRAGEERWKVIGIVEGVEIAVVFARRYEHVRIISARRASKDERKAYHEARARHASEGEDRLAESPLDD